MLRATEEDQKKKVRKPRKHRSVSQEGKLDNRRSSPNKSERSQKRYQSSISKRTDSSKLTKEEIKYQRFVRDLKKEIRVFLVARLRENRFDPSGKQTVPFNFTLKPKRATSTLLTHQVDETPIVTTSVANHPQNSMKSIKANDIERLTNDVQTLLAGPTFKSFYTQFIQPKPQRTISGLRLHPLDESIVLENNE